MADKYMLALARHEQAKQKVDGLSRRIGLAISRCQVVVKSEDYSLPNNERAELWDDKTGKHKTHLWQAFQVLEPSSCGYGEVHLCEDGMLEYLRPSNDGCRHCYRAYMLIKQRKLARAELGRARLAIRALGKQAMKEVGNV
ncbi:hypothetical protein ACUTAF_01990 [Pseudomonas sp. SP16.1]|uniref:hypothetical protein n=1 Tax=Pseudomonas sp. SP16.1 TaxID=3458854 RepID=UPI0040455702